MGASDLIRKQEKKLLAVNSWKKRSCRQQNWVVKPNNPILFDLIFFTSLYGVYTNSGSNMDVIIWRNQKHKTQTFSRLHFIKFTTTNLKGIYKTAATPAFPLYYMESKSNQILFSLLQII